MSRLGKWSASQEEYPQGKILRGGGMKALDARTYMYERARRRLHGHGGCVCLVDVGLIKKGSLNTR